MSSKKGGIPVWAILNLLFGIISFVGMFLPYLTIFLLFLIWPISSFQLASLAGAFLFVYVIPIGAILAIVFSGLAIVPSMAGRAKMLSVLVLVMGLLVFAGSMIVYLSTVQLLGATATIFGFPIAFVSVGIGLYIDMIAGILLVIFGIMMALKGP
ncbi:MAG: hypothetical protein WED05_08270 [Candidatus Atabeyarchaeum deiterrae]